MNLLALFLIKMTTSLFIVIIIAYRICAKGGNYSLYNNEEADHSCNRCKKCNMTTSSWNGIQVIFSSIDFTGNALPSLMLSIT